MEKNRKQKTRRKASPNHHTPNNAGTRNIITWHIKIKINMQTGRGDTTRAFLCCSPFFVWNLPIVFFMSFWVTSGTGSIIPHRNVFKTEFATWLDQDQHGNFAAAKEQFLWVTRSPNLVSTASKFIFFPTRKISRRILVRRTHQFLFHKNSTQVKYLQLQACSTVRRVCSWDILTFRTKLYISLPCFGRQSATNDLATPTQFPPTDRKNWRFRRRNSSSDKTMLHFLDYLYL